MTDNCAVRPYMKLGELSDLEVSLWLYRGMHICNLKSFSNYHEIGWILMLAVNFLCKIAIKCLKICFLLPTMLSVLAVCHHFMPIP